MESLIEGHYYHIYNRGASRSTIFFLHNDYEAFLKKYWFYLYIPCKTYCWCLLENHFHLLVKIRGPEEQERTFQKVKRIFPTGTVYGDHFERTKPYMAYSQFSHLLNSYTKSINLRRNRSGTLFESTFKRKRIIDENHFLNVACYIHRNPIHHNFTKSYKNYPYSSYKEILNMKNPLIEHENLIKRFGGKDNFLEAHQEFRLLLGSEFYLE